MVYVLLQDALLDNPPLEKNFPARNVAMDVTTLSYLQVGNSRPLLTLDYFYNMERSAVTS